MNIASFQLSLMHHLHTVDIFFFVSFYFYTKTNANLNLS